MVTARLYSQDDAAATHMWNWCYLHGKAQDLLNFDIFGADAPKPTEAGLYHVTIYGQEAIAVLAEHRGTLGGRVALVSDPESLAHALREVQWR